MWQHLGDQKHRVAPSRDGLAHQLLGGALAIHLGGVDVGHAALDAALQRGDGLAAVAGFDKPAALADHGHALPGGAKIMQSHHGIKVGPRQPAQECS